VIGSDEHAAQLEILRVRLPEPAKAAPVQEAPLHST
jgi:hypothetical protein